MGAFHAYDIRGIYNVDFDCDFAYKVGFFLPELLNADKVLVGRDVRVSSDEIFQYLAEGITDAGADVYNIGLATTPLVYFATSKHDFPASVQITASHNPREYNGMKVSRAKTIPVGLDTGLSTIKEWIENGKPMVKSVKKGVIRDFDVKQEYLAFLKSYKSDISNLNVGMDISNGMAALFVKDLFGEQPHYLFDELDGTFPNHEANPLVAKNIVDLQNLVKEKKCDIGVIFDGDADRVMFVDEKAHFISPDLMIALMGHYFFKDGRNKGAIVLQDIRSSKSVGEYLSRMGGKMATWRVGRAFAAPKLSELGGLYGGELAGHYYFRDFFYSDSGLLASLIILDIVADFKRKGITVSQAIDAITKYRSSGEINFKIEQKKEAMDAVRDYFSSTENVTAFYDFDGYRMEFPTWWFNIRPSNTEPYLRFICEAQTDEELAVKVAKVKEILSSCPGKSGE
ncbi:MAG: phosphomannomutase/phosphoglucomutase [Bacteroidales bacterium]|nr:phosphomannomutase/phosphoglucomutase [Bacteroidales bacterium]